MDPLQTIPVGAEIKILHRDPPSMESMGHGVQKSGSILVRFPPFWGRVGVRRYRAQAQLAAPEDGKGSTPVTLPSASVVNLPLD